MAHQLIEELDRPRMSGQLLNQPRTVLRRQPPERLEPAEQAPEGVSGHRPERHQRVEVIGVLVTDRSEQREPPAAVPGKPREAAPEQCARLVPPRPKGLLLG